MENLRYPLALYIRGGGANREGGSFRFWLGKVAYSKERGLTEKGLIRAFTVFLTAN